MHNVLNKNKIKLEPYDNFAYQAFWQFNENLINYKDPKTQNENDETPGIENYNENDCEDTETNETFAIPNFMHKILSDDENAEGINSLNSKQRKMFNVVRAKDYAIYNQHNVKPVHIFLSGSGGTCKPHLVKVIYNLISEYFFITVKTQKNRDFFYFELQQYQRYI